MSLGKNIKSLPALSCKIHSFEFQLFSERFQHFKIHTWKWYSSVTPSLSLHIPLEKCFYKSVCYLHQASKPTGGDRATLLQRCCSSRGGRLSQTFEWLLLQYCFYATMHYYTMATLATTSFPFFRPQASTHSKGQCCMV